MFSRLPTSIVTKRLGLGLVAAAVALQACAGGGASDGRLVRADDRASAVPATAASQLAPTQPSAAQSPLAAADYARAGDFKALARVAGGFFGVGKGEQSLVTAEREALRLCTSQSQYQGDCEIVRIGSQSIQGLDDAAEERVRWTYLRRVHERQAVTDPVKLRLPIKALVPGSQVQDGNLFLAGDFVAGGYSVIQFGDRTCSGALDPIERDEERATSDDAPRPPIGIMEYACDNGSVLRGGYVQADNANQIFFLEDPANERWDFIASTRNSRVGSELSAFKALYRSIERGE